MSNNKVDTHPSIETKGLNKKIYIIAYIVIGLIMCLVVFQVINSTNKPQTEEKEKIQEIQINENKIEFAPEPTSTGLLFSQPSEKAISKEVIEEKKTDPFTSPTITISRAPEPDEQTKRIMQMRQQRYLEALLAPTDIYKGNKNSSIANENNVSSQTIPAIQIPKPPSAAITTGENNYDVNADIDKEQFFERSTPDNQWINQYVRTAGQKYEIKTGSVIPAAMITGINSDLPGNLIAQVTQNVYDSTSGNYLLIPQGSKLYGVYDSRVIMGQQRVLVAWNRIVFPDGSAMTIPSIPGADMAGNSGFYQKVDNHYFRIFSSSILMALITAGTAYAVDESNNNDNENSLSSQLNSALAQQLGQVTTSLLQKNLNIKPTLEIEPGYQFNIVLTKDLVFGGSYKEWN